MRRPVGESSVSVFEGIETQSLHTVDDVEPMFGKQGAKAWAIRQAWSDCGQREGDTGSPASQVAVLTVRINGMRDHIRVSSLYMPDGPQSVKALSGGAKEIGGRTRESWTKRDIPSVS